MRENVAVCLMESGDQNRDGRLCRDEVERLYAGALKDRLSRIAAPSFDVLLERCRPRHSAKSDCIEATQLNATLLGPEPTCLPTVTHVAFFLRRVCRAVAENRLESDE